MLRPSPRELALTLALVAAAMPFAALSDVWSSTVRGLGGVLRSQLPASIVHHVVVALVLAAIVAWAGPAADATAAAAAFLAGAIASLATAGVSLRAATPADARAAHPEESGREWREVATTNFLIALFQAARAPAIVVIAGAYVESQQIAFYGAAQRLAAVASTGLLGLSGYAAPLIARCHAMGDVEGLRRVAMRSAIAGIATALPAALVLLAWGGTLLALFGPGFDTARTTLWMLLAGELAAAVCGPVGVFLTMTGRQRLATAIEAATSVGAVAFAWMLIPGHGILGAALAVTVGALARNAAMAIVVLRTLTADSERR